MELKKHDEIHLWALMAATIAGGLATRSNVSPDSPATIRIASKQADALLEELRTRIPERERG